MIDKNLSSFAGGRQGRHEGGEGEAGLAWLAVVSENIDDCHLHVLPVQDREVEVGVACPPGGVEHTQEVRHQPRAHLYVHVCIVYALNIVTVLNYTVVNFI